MTPPDNPEPPGAAAPGPGRAESARPAGLREQSRAEAMRRIRATAVELLAEKSFDEITTREVAQRAGIGEATLFRYVESKQELLMLAYGDRMDALLDAVEERDAELELRAGELTGGEFCGRVLAIFRARADFYLQSPDNARLYMRYGFDVKNPSLDRHLGQGDRIIALATRILRSGQRQGVLSSAVDAETVAENCHGTFIHEVDRTPVRHLPIEAIAERVDARLSAQLLPLFIDGSAGEPGKGDR
jgi:AcrR family transcriptional regulator